MNSRSSVDRSRLYQAGIGRSVRLGTKVTIPGSPGGVDFAPDFVEPIFDIDLTNIVEDDPVAVVREPGSWWLTVFTEVVPSEMPPGIIGLPLICEIAMGTGGTIGTFSVSPIPSVSLPIPSSYIRVLAKWDPFFENDGAVPVISPPTGIRLNALLQRTTQGQGAETGAFRTFYIPRNSGGILRAPIPRTAKTVQVLGNPGDAGLWDASSNLTLAVRGGSGIVARWTGPELFAAYQSGEKFPSPAPAGEFSFARSAILGGPAFVVFGF